MPLVMSLLNAVSANLTGRTCRVQDADCTSWTEERLNNLIHDWRFGIAAVFATARGSAYSFQSLGRACSEVKDQPTTGKKVFKAVWDCGIGAVTAAMLGGLAGVAAVLTFQNSGPALREYLSGIMNKRSVEELDLIGAEGSEHFSNSFGLTVRHLGHWNDTVTNGALQKRTNAGESEGVMRPVFGYTTPQGQDLHFSILARDEDTEAVTLRFGFGDNTRDGVEHTKRAPSEWFNSVGFDYKYLNRMPAPQGLDWHNDEMFAFLYDQLWCQMHVDFDYTHMDASQIYFQIIDNAMHGTRASMNIAVYGFDRHSGIDEMGDFRGSLYTDYRCIDYAET